MHDRNQAADADEVRARINRPLGMPAARFLRDYWQKRPLLIRAAYAGFCDPLTPDDLAGLACEELALSRIVLHTFPKNRKSPRSGVRRRDGVGAVAASELSDRWTVRTGPFAETDFAKMPKTNWTLLVQEVDKWDTDVAALLEPFAFLPSWRIDDVMVSYAEDGGSVGAHVDQYDVFLLQGLGCRRWQIDVTTVPGKNAPNPPHASRFAAEDFRDDTDLKLLREFTPTHEWVLEPGDMLYLPPGIPHHGVAVGACMTYSIGMRAPSHAELLLDFAQTLAECLPDDVRMTDPDLSPARLDGEIGEGAMARVIRAMPWCRLAARAPSQQRAGTTKALAAKAPGRGGRRSSLSAVDPSLLRIWFGEFITRYRSAQTVTPGPRPLTDAAFARALSEDAPVRRNPWSRFAWMRARRGAIVFAAGAHHACTIGFARMVCTQARFSVSLIPVCDRTALRALIDAGHLALETRRPPRKSQ